MKPLKNILGKKRKEEIVNMAEDKDLPKLSWLEKKLIEDKELGYESETFRKGGKRYYKINIKDDYKVLIQDRGPHKHDYSVSLFLPPDTRDLIKPKTREEYRNGAKDRKWRFTRAIVACDDIEELPNILDFIGKETFHIPETKKEILTKDVDLLKEIKEVSSKPEVDPIEVGEIIEKEESQEIIIPQKIVIKPRTSTKNPISHETLLIEEIQEELDEEKLDTPKEVENSEENTKEIEEIIDEDISEGATKISTLPISPTEEIIADIPLKEYEEPEIVNTPAVVNSFRSLDEMYSDLVSNNLNPSGVLNKEPGTGKYMELEWMVKHFSSKQDFGKVEMLRGLVSKYN